MVAAWQASLWCLCMLSSVQMPCVWSFPVCFPRVASPPSPPLLCPCSIAAKPELKPLRVGLAAFLRRSVGPWLAVREPGSGGLSSEQLGELLRRLRGAEKALAA